MTINMNDMHTSILIATQIQVLLYDEKKRDFNEN